MTAEERQALSPASSFALRDVVQQLQRREVVRAPARGGSAADRNATTPPRARSTGGMKTPRLRESKESDDDRGAEEERRRVCSRGRDPPARPKRSQRFSEAPWKIASATSTHPIQNSGSKTFIVMMWPSEDRIGASAAHSAAKECANSRRGDGRDRRRRARHRHAASTAKNADANSDSPNRWRANHRAGRQRRLIDIAPLEVFAAGDEIELVAEQPYCVMHARCAITVSVVIERA